DQTPMAVALREGREFRAQSVTIERPDGSRTHVLVNIDPIRDAQGRVVGAINAFHDITELMQTQLARRESEERFFRFMQNLPGLAWIKDLEGRYVFANASAEDAFQVSGEELYGKRDEEIFPTDIASRFRTNDREALAN